MATVSSSITINQPVDKVFAYVIAVENHKAWQTGVLEAKEGVAALIRWGPWFTLHHCSCGGSFPAVTR